MIRFERICRIYLEEEQRMLPSPERPFFIFFRVILGNILSICLDRTVGNSILNKSLTTNLSRLMHRISHLVKSWTMVDVFDPCSNNMYCAKKHITFLFSHTKTRKSSCNAICFYTALIEKHISWTPARSKSSDYL